MGFIDIAEVDEDIYAISIPMTNVLSVIDIILSFCPYESAIHKVIKNTPRK